MSEQTPEPTAAPVAPEAPTQTATQNVVTLPEWAREAISKANREAATYRTQLREVEPLAKKAQELEEAQKTEAQRLAERQVAVERERDEARAEGLRYKAAATHGIGQDYFDLLGSGDEETIAARAERVGGLIRENTQMKAELEALRAGKPAPSTGRPVEALKPGATPTNSESADDALYNSLFGGQ